MKLKFNQAIPLGIIIAGFSLTTGCFFNFSTMKGKDRSIKAIEKFNEQINASKYQEICTESADKFKEVTTNEDCLKLFEAVTRKLGQRKSGALQQWNINAATGGTFVRLVYNTEFDLDKGVEEFVYYMDGDQPKLAGYHVNSNAFLK
jgi:hypothetical protein